MIDGSKKHKHQLVFELQSLRVYEKCSNLKICKLFAYIFVFPTPETIMGMGTSFWCNDFWDRGQVLVLIS